MVKHDCLRKKCNFNEFLIISYSTVRNLAEIKISDGESAVEGEREKREKRERKKGERAEMIYQFD